MTFIIGQKVKNTKGKEREIWCNRKDFQTNQWYVDYVNEKGYVCSCLKASMIKWMRT